MSALDKTIVEKIQSWSNLELIKQWVDESVASEADRALQVNILQQFWVDLLDYDEEDKLYLLQKVVVILAFPEQAIKGDFSQLGNLSQRLDTLLRRHITLNCIKSFPQIRDVKQVYDKVHGGSDSFKQYWQNAFKVIKIIVLLDASISPDFLFKSDADIAKQKETAVKYACMLQNFSDYFEILDVANNHDAMDDVSLISALIREREPDETLCMRYGIDSEIIENLSDDVRYLIFHTIQRAYLRMGDYFSHYHVLGDGFRMSSKLREAIEIHHRFLAERVKLLKQDSSASISSNIQRFWYTWGKPDDIDKQIEDEYKFWQKILFVNQQGCLNLAILVQIKNMYPDLFTYCHEVTKTLYLDIKNELSEQLLQRAEYTDDVPMLSIDDNHPLYQHLQQEHKERKSKSPPLCKGTPTSSPALLGARSTSTSTLGQGETSTSSAIVPYKERSGQLYGTSADKRKQHQHSRTCGNAQKDYMVEWVLGQLHSGSLQLKAMQEETKELCCLYWKYGTKDRFKDYSQIHETEAKIRRYIKTELAILAGSDGQESARHARERHAIESFGVKNT